MRKVLIICSIALVTIFVAGSVYFYFHKDDKKVETEILQVVYKQEIYTDRGIPIDLLSTIEIKNSNRDQFTIEIEGAYSFDEVGIYNLVYVIKKDNKEIDRKGFILNVLEPEQENTNVEIEDTQIENSSIVTDVSPTYINGVLIVNKTYPLPRNYGNGLTNELLDAFNRMASDAFVDGIYLNIISGYRSYYNQEIIYNNYVARDGVEVADTYSARPGHSEHQSGLAIDINSLDSSFASTPEGIWLNNNAYKYGFILRYPYGKTNETGYVYEPWHFRYVGNELSSILYNNGDWITLEAYFGLTSSYQ